MDGSFFKKLPKIELHAHLNGSISTATIDKLLAKRKNERKPPDLTALQHWKAQVEQGNTMTLKGCFEMFALIHQLVDNCEAVAILTCDVIREFAEDGVKYLELRSTPRDVQETGMTKRTYVETVLSSIQQCKEEGLDIIVKYLLTIDRGRDLQTARETVELAKEFLVTGGGVVDGLDFSGDPNKNDAAEFVPLLKDARQSGLKLAVHLAEIVNIPDSLSLVQLPPDRIGHGTFLLPSVGGSEELVEIVRRNRTPLEVCLTSNFIGKTVDSFDQHHFKFWYSEGHPCTICTDDKGIFASALSNEYLIAAATFNLTREQIWELSTSSIEYIFADDETKDMLRKRWSQEKSNLAEAK